MEARSLPVYLQRDRILKALETHQVVVVESPTGSGKTTQIPLILHEAGYTRRGIVGVTQPRRIAAVSVSRYIARPDRLGHPGHRSATRCASRTAPTPRPSSRS